MANTEDGPVTNSLDEMYHADTPKIYTNGFQIVMSNADIAVLFTQNGKTAGVVNMSYTVAKTLSQKVDELIKRLETKSEQTIMTTDDIGKYLED
jgi:light-regulated signal transduction histidine kinase (bacteriophytochrome)